MSNQKSSYEKMKSERLFTFSEDLRAEQNRCISLQNEYNATTPYEYEKRMALLPQMFAEVGEGSYIEPPLRANWGGKFVHLGKHFYANFNLTLVDDCEIYIGDHVYIAPNVVLTTAGHPMAREIRDLGYQFNASIHIGNSVWIGANAVVLPGITIGDNCVIGAGSVVTKDIPANSVAVGNPCRVLRQINEHDYEYYWRDKKIEPEELEVIARVRAEEQKSE